MITPAYVVTMARYNAWQNRQLTTLLEPLPERELTKDRGAFFGSILRTVNHLLWGDMIWMSRIHPTYPAPGVSFSDSVDLCPTIADWGAQRFRCDGRIRLWAEGVGQLDLTGNLTWTSASNGQRIVEPLALCIVHMFNHQTHHRGQVHAMLTGAGIAAPISDLVDLPEDF